jgi:hypothetical protein
VRGDDPPELEEWLLLPPLLGTRAAAERCCAEADEAARIVIASTEIAARILSPLSNSAAIHGAAFSSVFYALASEAVSAAPAFVLPSVHAGFIREDTSRVRDVQRPIGILAV